MARPSITLKLATSLDGKIALANGASQWVTGEQARAAGRMLRAEHDAICVGANTAHLDNPQLTSRIDGASDPIRIIFDSRARLSPQSNLAQTAQDTPVLLFCREASAEQDNAKALCTLGVSVLPIAHSEDGLNVSEALSVMRAQGIESLLIEGGGRLAASFVQLDCVDRIAWFRAPKILGGDGRDAIGPLGLSDMAQVKSFARVSITEYGDDICETYQKVSA